MPNVPDSSEDQLSEHVPWENLTIPPQQDRRFLVYGLAAGLVVAVLGVVVVRQLSRPAASEVLPVTTVRVEPVDVTQPPETVPAPVVETPPPTLPPAALEPEPDPGANMEFTEADLKAVDTETVRSQVAGRAEWVVLEYFTIDPSEPWRERVETASGFRLPAQVAPDTPSAPTVSYVEWARTRSVDREGADTYRASVLIRRLVATDGATFERLPTEWVELHLRMDADGVVRATSLPRIITPPQESLIPLGDEYVEWFTDSTGISWPASSPPDETG